MPISHRSGPYEVPAGAGTSPQGEQLWARWRRCRASGTALRGDRRAGEAVAAVLDVTGEPLRPRAVAADRDGHVVPAARLGDRLERERRRVVSPVNRRRNRFGSGRASLLPGSCAGCGWPYTFAGRVTVA